MRKIEKELRDAIYHRHPSGTKRGSEMNLNDLKYKYIITNIVRFVPNSKKPETYPTHETFYSAKRWGAKNLWKVLNRGHEFPVESFTWIRQINHDFD